MSIVSIKQAGIENRKHALPSVSRKHKNTQTQN